jgi:YjbE family integral membrane protein
MLIVLGTWSDQIASYLEWLVGADPGFVVSVLRIIWINIILSGDNAVVIALACRTLAPRQRMIGVVLGAVAAVVLRIMFTVLVQQLFGIPWLKLAGGLVLFWIAVKLLLAEPAHEENVRSGANVWEAVRIVAIADIVMSLDNVLAIAAAAGNQTSLIVFGLSFSIPLVVFGAPVLMWMMDRIPLLVWAGSALLGWVAAELIATEPVLEPYFETVAGSLGVTLKIIDRSLETLGAALVVGIGWLLMKASERQRTRAAAKQSLD